MVMSPSLTLKKRIIVHTIEERSVVNAMNSDRKGEKGHD